MRFFRRQISDKQFNLFARVIKRSSKVITIVVLITLFLTYVPWNLILLKAESNAEDVFVDVLDGVSEEARNTYSSVEVDPSNIPVDFEIEEKRTENEKYFRKIDGTYEAVLYSDAVHYEEDGKWKDIDNSFSDLGNNYQNKQNKFKVKLPKKLDDNKTIDIKYQDYKISWNILNINRSTIDVEESVKVKSDNKRSPQNISETVRYKDIQENLDLEYIIEGKKLKENFILHQYIENFQVNMNIKTKGLSLIEKDEELVFVNKNGAVIFNMDKLFMYDSKEVTSYDIDYQLTEIKDGKEFQLKIIPSDEWLMRATYPVVVDPTLKSRTTSMSICDTYVAFTSPTSNYDDLSTFYTGITGYPYHGLLSFYIPSSIMDKVITYSHLSLTPSQATARQQINLYQNTNYFTHKYCNLEN